MLDSGKITESLNEFLVEHLGKATPGVLAQAYKQGRKVLDYAAGENYPIYDLASLTKVIFTVPALMWAYQQNRWNEQTKVQEIISWFPHAQTKVADLLTHSSGLIWWEPFYEKIDQSLSNEKKWESLRHILMSEPLNQTLGDSPKSVYSDVGFLTLAFVLMELFEKPLYEVFLGLQDQLFLPSGIHFNPQNKPTHERRLYAPTETVTWRNKVIQGEVHDDNCWSLGGVTTHAGLFGSIQDVSDFVLMLRAARLGLSTKLPINQNVLTHFTTRHVPPSVGDWALGFMMPSASGSSSGQYFSPSSVGHTGFTGTSFWWDIEQDIIVVILSNRVLLGRENKVFSQLIRPKIHDLIVSHIMAN